MATAPFEVGCDSRPVISWMTFRPKGRTHTITINGNPTQQNSQRGMSLLQILED